MRQQLLVTILTAAALEGCTHVVKSDPATVSHSGFAYSLPKGQMLFQASRTPIDKHAVADAQAASTKADAAADAADKALAAAKSAGDDAKTASAQTAADTAAKNKTAAKAALDVATENAGKWQETATLTPLPIAPDPTARYVANLNHSPLRDDTLTLSAPGGLLSTSNATSTDETPAILVTLADTAIALTSGFAPVANAAPSKDQTKKPVCPYNISAIIDPTSDTDLKAVQQLLTASNASLQLNNRSSKPSNENKPTIQPKDATHGLVYRIATQALLTIDVDRKSVADDAACPLAALPTSQSISAIVPDTNSSYLIEEKAAPFTTTTLSYGFTSGMLTDYTAKRPSEVAAVAGIPLRIANDIIQVPAQLIQLRVNLDSQKTLLANAQASFRAAQIQQSATLLAARASVINAQTALDQAELNQPAAVAAAKTALTNALKTLNDAQAALKKGTGN